MDSPISALPAATPLDGSELLPIVQGGVTKVTTIAAVAKLWSTQPVLQFMTAALPAAAMHPFRLAWVLDGTGQKFLAISDGTNWHWINDGPV